MIDKKGQIVSDINLEINKYMEELKQTKPQIYNNTTLFLEKYISEYEIKINNLEYKIKELQEKLDKHLKREPKEIEKIDLSGRSEEFIKTFNAFLEMRKKIKKPATIFAQKLIIKELEKLSKNENKQILILNQSIRRDYQDVYELKEDKNGKEYNGFVPAKRVY